MNQTINPIEECLKIITDSQSVMNWISGVDKLFYFFNDGWLRFTGRSMEQECGNGWMEGVHEKDVQRCLEVYINSFVAREPYQMEYRLRRHDGAFRWLIEKGVPRYLEDGTFAGYVGSCMDIEGFKPIQGKTEGEYDRLNSFFMQAPAGICILGGPDLVFELINPAYQELLPDRVLLNRPIFEALPELKDQPLQRVLSDVYNTGGNFEAQELLIPVAEYEGGPVKDRFFNFNYLARRNEFEDVDGILVFVYEVTEQVNARKNAERAEGRLRMAIDAAGLATYHINTTDRVFHASGRLKELFGFGADEEVPYEAAISQIHENYRQAAADMVEAAITKGVRFDMEYPVVGYNDGKTRWVRGIGEIQPDPDGKRYFTGLLHEITERKEDEIRKNDFIGMVSHELKTPLTSLNGYLQLLASKENQDNFTRNALEKSNKQVKKMTTMINGFLNMARLESGKIAINKHIFDMARLIKESEEEVMAMISTHHIIFAPVERTIVFADSDKIGQVITNLVGNAAKYSPPGRMIKVACVTINGTAQVSVKDEGIGVKPEDINHIFDRYYRVEGNNTISGFGIGLYLAKEIIHRHEGKIWVESELGKGSSFYFSLALKNEGGLTPREFSK